MRTSRAGSRPRTSRARLLTGALAVIAAAAVPSVAAVPARAVAGHPPPAAAKTPGRMRNLTTEPQAIAQAKRTGKPVLVTAATTASSTLTANPSGSLTLDEQNQPVRKNVGGTWKPLDPTLHRNADGTVSPAVTTSALTLSGGGTGPLVTMTAQGHTLSLTLPVKLPAPALSGDTATYPDVPVPGADLQVTADAQGGYEDTIVVKNAAAAANPALRSFTLRPSATGGLTLHVRPDGSLTADSRGGHAFFEFPAATMWDSRPAAGSIRTAADPAYGGRRVDLRDGQPVTSAATSPGENARTAHLGTRYSRGTLTYTPDMSVLAGKNAVYPVYIDPAAGSTRTFWAQADSAWPSQTYPKPNPMQVGDNIWQTTYFTARSFVNESVPSTIDGSSTDIESATLYLTDEYAPTCSTSAGDEGVQVWRTGAVGTGTTWSNQPSWAAEEAEKSFVHGYSSSCPPASEGFNIKEAMTAAAHNSWSQVTFGIRADNESDEYGWKQFSSTVTLSTTYDKPPNAPGNMKTSPVTSCTAATPTTVGLGDVTLYTTLTDPLGSNAGSLTATVNVTDMATGKAFTGSPFKFTGLGSGSIATVRLPESTLKTLAGTSITEFSWNATATDGTLTSPTSTTCHFKFDPSSPGQPCVFPATSTCDPSAPPTVTYTIGTPASFDVTPNDSGVTPTSYNYQVNGAAVHTVTANSSGDATITVTPTSGTDALTVTAISAGGNIGESATDFFNATASAPAADGDLTGDGIPDLVTPGGGTTGLAPGLWLARGQAGPGGTPGDGQVITSTADIGSEGDGITSDYSPNDFTGAQVITGQFNDNGFQDTLAYYPTGTSYPGEGAILGGNGDGAVLDNQDSSNTTLLDTATFTGVGDPYNDIPLQVANGYNADPNDNPAYPDLLTVSGDSTNGYYLEYYQEGGTSGLWWNSFQLSNPAPDGTMNWDQWQITTMAEPSGTVDMFLSNATAHTLYLWQNFTVDDSSDTASYTQYQLSSTASPGTLSEIRAADITGTGPALWSVSTTGTATAWIVSGLSSGTPAVTVQPAQSLLSPTHNWRLGDGTDGEATTAADTGNGTALPLTGTSTGVTWTTGDLFNPAANFDGTTPTTGYMNTTAGTGAYNNTGDYTISAWVKPAAAGGAIFAQSDASTDESCMDLYINSATTSGGTTYQAWDFGTTSSDAASFTATVATSGTTYPVHVGSWTHLAVTYNAANKFMRLYVNGMPAAAAVPSTVWTANCNTFEIGHYLTSGQGHALFDGDIADVQVWNGTALNPTEVADLSGTPGYILFPSDGTTYPSAATATTWQWKTDCAEMNNYQGKITVKETCGGTSTATFGPGGSPGAYMILQSDGNLVLRSSSGATLWAAGTSNTPGDVMFLQPDGNLVIYGTYGQTLWSSGTQN